MTTSTEQLGLTILAAAEVPNFLAGMLPSKMTISRFAADEFDRAAIRRGEVIGSGLSLAVGIGASLVARSWWPLVACGVVLVVLLYEYEDSLRNPHPSGNGPIG